ncbi:hypothetical protein PUN28_003801 [Cardiocondyla obscurior]|uniref:Uncharacterized protein n=1 Tax=Cardiocondyla obscurior TaxID=286306 RepID=A0AAW2GNT2_9HYME
MALILFFLVTTIITFVEVRPAPAKYDQRQDGEFNLQAQLENFLFVFAIPTSNDHLGDLALGALEAISRSKEQALIKSGKVNRQEEPYSLEIVQISENHSNKESPVRKAEGGDAVISSALGQQSISIGDGRVARNVKSFEFPKSRQVPTVPGYLLNTRKTLGPKKRTGSRARNVIGNVWNPNSEPERPGTSLKRQLPRREEEEPPLSNGDKNDVSSGVPKEKQELILLGDGVENCGPGRHRDASGICQFDESVGSLL